MDLEDFEDDLLDEMMNLSDSVEEKFQTVQGQKRDSNDKQPTLAHLNTLLKWFGHKTFRPMQWDIIRAILEDRRDVCAVMATGYGKSLCYQYPAVYAKGIALVVSPLISLMEDQVLSLTMANIPACFLGSAQVNQNQVVNEILDKKYSVIYLTPEFCTGDFGQDLLQRINTELTITLIAIDEAHCVSSWGHDFRFQYQQLGFLHGLLPGVPILAVTATATFTVREDIVKSLKLKRPLVMCSGLDRPNLYFEVNLKSSVGIMADLKKVMTRRDSLWKFSGPTIIYCITRKQVEEVDEVLKNNGVRCLPYHAGLSLSVRKSAHEQFVKDKVDLIVATIAFGMGIDKPDVRNVIHYGSSRAIEEYYQEVGRAGRDGLPSNCIMFYSKSDFACHRRLIETNYGGDAAKCRKRESLQEMDNYFVSTKCRRRFILDHFGEKCDETKGPQKNCCDNCTKLRSHFNQNDHEKYEGIDEKGLYDFTQDAAVFMSAVQEMGGKFGTNLYILFLRGSNSVRIRDHQKKLASYGSGKSKSEEWWKAIAAILFREKYLREKIIAQAKFSYSTIDLKDKGTQFLSAFRRGATKPKLLLPPPPDILILLKRKPQERSNFQGSDNRTVLPSSGWLSVYSNSNQPSTSASAKLGREPVKTDHMELYTKLLEKRTELASNHDCMPYMVASNTGLMQMSKQRPATIDQLRSCKLDGFTEAKIEKFGRHFLEVVNLGGESSATEDMDKEESIKSVLERCPLPNVSVNPTAEITYSQFKCGLTVPEIAESRSLVMTTIVSHLVRYIRMGYPIKLKDLGVTAEEKDLIIREIRKFDTDINELKMKDIKNTCPEEITYEKISVVLAYMQVRVHLENEAVPYEDFEDFEYTTLDMEKPGSDPDYNLSVFLKLCNQMSENEAINRTVDEVEADDTDSDATVVLEDQDYEEPPAKRDKIDPIVDGLSEAPKTSVGSSVLHSPKRQPTKNIRNEEDFKTIVTVIDDSEENEPVVREPKNSFSVLDSPPRNAVNTVAKKVCPQNRMESGVQPVDDSIQIGSTIANTNGLHKKTKQLVLPPWLRKR